MWDNIPTQAIAAIKEFTQADQGESLSFFTIETPFGLAKVVSITPFRMSRNVFKKLLRQMHNDVLEVKVRTGHSIDSLLVPVKSVLFVMEQKETVHLCYKRGNASVGVTLEQGYDEVAVSFKETMRRLTGECYEIELTKGEKVMVSTETFGLAVKYPPPSGLDPMVEVYNTMVDSIGKGADLAAQERC